MSRNKTIGCWHHNETNCCNGSGTYKLCPGATRLGCTNRISFKCWTDNKRCGANECKCQCYKCKSSISSVTIPAENTSVIISAESTSPAESVAQVSGVTKTYVFLDKDTFKYLLYLDINYYCCRDE